MRVDLDKLAADRDARRARQASERTLSTMVDLAVEARVLGAMIADYPLHECTRDPRCCVRDGVRIDDALAACDDVETDDFHVLPHKLVLGVLRDLQSAGKPCGIAELDVEIERLSKLPDGSPRAIGQLARNSVGLLFLFDLATTGEKYGPRGLARDIAKLRELANLRRLA